MKTWAAHKKMWANLQRSDENFVSNTKHNLCVCHLQLFASSYTLLWDLSITCLFLKLNVYTHVFIKSGQLQPFP